MHRLARLAYTTLFFLLLPLIFFRLWRKGAHLPAYRERWAERLGKISKRDSDRPAIWFHTVSVGEFIAAIPLIRHYINSQQYDVIITTMTPTGSDRVHDTFSNEITHIYLPYDLPFSVNRFLNATRPNILVCLETELWPNLINLCCKRDIPVVLANARMSEKSARGYRRFSALTYSMLNTLSLAAVQNHVDAERLIKLGLQRECTKIIGNIKFDLSISEQVIASAHKLKAQLSENGKFKVFIAASTHQGEDEPVLRAFSKVRASDENVKLMIVPRHPERFASVFTLCEQTGLRCARRSDNTSAENIDILLCDTMGELLMLYGAADMAFVGGSLIDNGGHNYIEPAAWALPIISGPSTINFREIASELQAEGALRIINDSEQLARELLALITDPAQAIKAGNAGKQVAEKNKGALEKLIALIDAQLEAN